MLASLPHVHPALQSRRRASDILRTPEFGEKGVKEGRGTTESVSSSVASSRTSVLQAATADRPFSPLNTEARVGTIRKADHFAERRTENQNCVPLEFPGKIHADQAVGR